MAQVQVLYFASLRDQLGCDQENIEVDAGATVDDLIAQLRSRGGAYEQAFAPDALVRTAVEQEFADGATKLVAGAEVGMFPPVTGG